MYVPNWPTASQVKFSERAPKLHVFAVYTHNHVAVHSDQAVRHMQLVDGQNFMVCFSLGVNLKRWTGMTLVWVGSEEITIWLFIHKISLLVNIYWIEQFSLTAPWKTLAIIMSSEKCEKEKDQAACLLPAWAESVPGSFRSPVLCFSNISPC